MGNAKAAVLPVPVCAVPIRSLPDKTMGKARNWIGVGSVKPIACVPRTTSGESPKSLNDTALGYRLTGKTQRDILLTADYADCADYSDGSDFDCLETQLPGTS